MPLQRLRKARQLTQSTLAGALEIPQGDVSKLERRTDCYVGTLRYVAALGGELDIVARFADGDVRITQFHELEDCSSRRDLITDSRSRLVRGQDRT